MSKLSILGYGYWHSVTHASFHIQLNVKGADENKRNPLPRTELQFIDAAGRVLAKGISDELYNFVHLFHPEVGDCHELEKVATTSKNGRTAWQVCFAKLAICLFSAPIAIFFTILLLPVWSWVEATFAVESSVIQGRPFWHWVVFCRRKGRPVILDPAAYLEKKKEAISPASRQSGLSKSFLDVCLKPEKNITKRLHLHHFAAHLKKVQLCFPRSTKKGLL